MVCDVTRPKRDKRSGPFTLPKLQAAERAKGQADEHVRQCQRAIWVVQRALRDARKEAAAKASAVEHIRAERARLGLDVRAKEAAERWRGRTNDQARKAWVERLRSEGK